MTIYTYAYKSISEFVITIINELNIIETFKELPKKIDELEGIHDEIS